MEEQKEVINDHNYIEKITKIKMQLIINRDIYEDTTINYEMYKSIEDKLLSKLVILKSKV